jgi:acyl-CoA thioester hydrolase
MYYEVARTDALKQIGITYKSLEENGVMMPVIQLSSKFIKSAKYDDELTIICKMKTYSGVRVEIEYELYNASKELINTGETTLVYVDMKTNRPTRCPHALAEKMKPFFE